MGSRESWQPTPYQILSIGFASVILLGTLILMTPMVAKNGVGLSFVDALFTATSAVCVTGLVVVDTGAYFNLFGQLVIISLIQIGGLGFMTLATMMSIAFGKQINLRERLIMQEAFNQLNYSGVVRLTLNVIKMTLAIEFIGGTILAWRFFQDYGSYGIYLGYWHAVSSFCNAGFDLIGDFRSMTPYVGDITINLAITLLIIAGGIGFTVIIDLWQQKGRLWQCSLHSRMVVIATFFLIVFGTIVIYALEIHNPATLGALSEKERLLASYFQAVSPRTAGYNTIDIGAMRDVTIFFTVILMFIGASPSSTGGGIKTTTFAVLALSVWGLVRGKTEVHVFNRSLGEKTVHRAFVIVAIAMALVTTITLLMSAIEDVPFLRILFEVTSAFGTVGLTCGITTSLSDPSKLLLVLTMFAGRVGPLTLALALALKSRHGLIRYPEGRIIIG